DELSLPVKNALAGMRAATRSAARGEDKDEPTPFYCPGAILRAEVAADLPLAHGLEPETPIWFESSPAFEASGANVVLRYSDANFLFLGWLLGDERLQGKAALVEVTLGAGKVVLFGFRPQYRAQSWATYIALANAIYLSAVEPSR